ncbi:transcriptional regulator [Opitutaceae bacterium TAV1]|nr:transcriptional regulator [Opitutaceae bacterium TAV1]
MAIITSTHTAIRHSKPDAVYTILKERIAQGYWKIGEQLPVENTLAGELQCSRSTIALAVGRLVHDGVLERRPRTGTRVLRMEPQRLATSVGLQQKPALALDACAYIYPSAQHEGVWRIASGFQERANHAGRQAVMLSMGTNFRREAEAVGRLAEFDVKGAVLFPVILTPQDHDYYTRMVLSCPFPVVFVEINLPGSQRPAVVVDGFHAGRAMTRHLLGKGLRKIGFLANYAWTSIARDKHLGYRETMLDAGIENHADWTQRDMEMRPDYDNPLTNPTEIARRYLKAHPDVEGVVCSHDYLALGLLRAAQETGRRVPEDLLVTGMDDFALGATASTPLTTYRVPYETIGARAFEILSGLLSGQQPGTPETQVRGEIVLRTSA